MMQIAYTRWNIICTFKLCVSVHACLSSSRGLDVMKGLGLDLSVSDGYGHLVRTRSCTLVLDSETQRPTEFYRLWSISKRSLPFLSQ